MTDLDSAEPRHDTPDNSARRIPWRTIGLVVVAWVIVAAFAPALIVASFSDFGTFARVIAVVVGLVLWSRVIGRFVPDRRAAMVLRLVPVLLVGWFWLAPYFMEGDTADDPFPVANGLAPVAAAPTTTSPPPTTSAAPVDGETDAPATTTSTTTTAPPAPAEPVALSTGSFKGLTGHRGAGTATVFDLGGGDLLLRLDDFDTGPGPDLDLWVVPGEDRRSRDGGVKIADLSATRGNQNHDLPDDLAFDGPVTVLVWCNTFDVEVSNATVT